jgi:NAD+ synthase (glutamine-hydrolysing)
MQIGLAQMNSYLGDFAGNREVAYGFVKKAKAQGCELLVFPELSLFGYWPSDMLERSQFVDEQWRQLKLLHRQIPSGIAVLIGCVSHSKSEYGKWYNNSAALLIKDKPIRIFSKELLPSYDVFDEHRYFEPGQLEKNTFTYKGEKILVTICEDIWASGEAWVGTRYPKNPLNRLKKVKPDLIVNLSASPYSGNKANRRHNVAGQAAKLLKAPIVYVNLVGAQDEIIFDGGSFVLNEKAQLLKQARFFDEDLVTWSTKDNKTTAKEPKSDTLERSRQALVLGIRDYVRKTGFEKVHLGLSGGVDSALVAVLAKEALGAENLTCIYLPGPYSTDQSERLATELAKNLGCAYHTLNINETYESALKTFEDCFGKKEFGVTQENLQARLRGLFLMAFSNSNNSMLLTTGNKSEYATGYATLYGDMCGGLAPIADLLKTEVFEMCRLINKEKEVIPVGIIDRPPSAELRPDQKDEDTLPPYDELDRIVDKLVVNCKPTRGETEKWVLKALARNEFKRWQAPPVLRVSQHAFGRGRRVPIATRYDY